MPARKSVSPSTQLSARDDGSGDKGGGDAAGWYTNEEVNFLQQQLKLLAQGNSLAPNAANKNKDPWTTMLPTLVRITEKALSKAAASYCSGPDPGASLPTTTMMTTRESDVLSTEASTNTSTLQPLSHANFIEENEYLLEQLQQLPVAPFTLQRLLEILQQPMLHHCKPGGKLRGEVLQSSLRRCILVACPAFMSSGEESSGAAEAIST